MAISLKHAKTSTVPDSGNTALVQPSDWNAEHTISLAAGKVLGRDTSGAGVAQELPIAVTAAGLVGVGTATSPAVALDVGATDAVRVAAGTTAQRPTGAAGYVRYNSTLGRFEGYATDWGTFAFSSDVAATYLPLTGGTLTGALSLGSNTLTAGATTITTLSATAASVSTLNTTGNAGVGVASAAARLDVSGNYAQNIVNALSTPGYVNCSLGNYFIDAISGNITYSFINAPASRAYSFTLELAHNSGTVTWPIAVQWPGGTAPTLTAGKTHLFMFVTDDGGTRWRGAALVDYTT